jgi:uncharacterized protein
MIFKKSQKLDEILKGLGSSVVAFSGGVDSSFLLYRASELTAPNTIGVTIRTPYIPAHEINDAIEFTKKYGIRHHILDVDFPEIIRKNPLERCYFCKKNLFTSLLTFAKKSGYAYVLDGSNADDQKDFRPGTKALRELEIRSPLLESGLTKKEIRELSLKAGLPVWDKPAMACLLTRIPYETEVTDVMLRMIEKAEYFLFNKGYPGTRVRMHGDTARIECLPGYFERIIQSTERIDIITNMKKIGFRYVSLDLEGYRTGSSNPEIEKT